MRALIDFLFATSGGPAFPDKEAVASELAAYDPRQVIGTVMSLVNLSLQNASPELVRPISADTALYVYPILKNAPTDRFIHFVELPDNGFSIRLMDRTQPELRHDVTVRKDADGTYNIIARDASGARFGSGDSHDVLNYVGNWMRMNFRVGTLKTAHEMSQRAMPFDYRP